MRFRGLPGTIWMLACTCLVPTVACAWGNQGHDIIAAVAYDRLTPDAQHAVNRILGRVALMDGATWPDKIRLSRRETSNWHFVDIPLAESSYDEARDCKLDPERGDCAVKAIARCEAALRDGTDGCGQSETESLEFLIHFIGDIHQPLHCEDDTDRGGNEKAVCFFRACSKKNLHATWDTYMLVKEEPEDQAWIDKIETHIGTLSEADIAQITQGTVVDWVNESHSLARDPAYHTLPRPDAKQVFHLSNAYYTKNVPVVDQQLERAAVRLATILEQLLAP